LALGLASAQAGERIVSLGGEITEIVYALGDGGKLVAVDSTSSYPAAAGDLPDVGYVRALSAEGVLALEPDLILASPDAGPPNVMAQLRATGVEIYTAPEEASLAGITEKIRGIAGALGREEAGDGLVKKFEAEVERTRSVVGGDAELSAVYLMGRGDGVLLAAGTGTAADTMLRASGLINVITTYEGYKPVSPESLLALGPRVIVTGERTVGGVGGVEKLKAMPGVAGKVVVMDDLYLLGMGPRAAQAALDLAQAARE
jgi:iron complex transport system substrate-binding protein